MVDIPLTADPAVADVSHRDIIERAGGPAAFGRSIDPPVEANTTKQWKRLDSIPSPYWDAIARAELATLAELAAAAARRRAAPETAQEAAA